MKTLPEVLVESFEWTTCPICEERCTVWDHSDLVVELRIASYDDLRGLIAHAVDKHDIRPVVYEYDTEKLRQAIITEYMKRSLE